MEQESLREIEVSEKDEKTQKREKPLQSAPMDDGIEETQEEFDVGKRRKGLVRRQKNKERFIEEQKNILSALNELDLEEEEDHDYFTSFDKTDLISGGNRFDFEKKRIRLEYQRYRFE